jgi:ATP-dependent Clp protease ATP-binding subunit ClpC
MYTIADDINRYRPTLSLVKFLSRKTLNRLRLLFLALATLAFIASQAVIFLHLETYSTFLLGLALVSTGLWLEQILIYSYHNSYYFHGLNSILGLEGKKVSGITYEMAEALLIDESDVTKSFCLSQIGAAILLRSGIDLNAVDTYLHTTRPKINTQMIPLPQGEIFSLISLGQYLLQQDSSFKTFIKEQGITENSFIGALRWVVTAHHTEKKRERWWGRDNLSKKERIGREWSYGTTYLLEKFSRNLKAGAIFNNFTTNHSTFTADKIAEVEVALARAKASNILIIGEAGVGKIDLLLEVSHRIQTGKSLNAIADQQMILLDTNRLFALHKTKQELEITLLQLFTEAAKAGNVIIVIENLSNFIHEAQALGVFIPELLDPFLATPVLHIIATDTPSSYHTYLEPLGAFTRRFAEVLLEETDSSSTTKILQDIALSQENKYQVLFTYESLLAITVAADRYIIEGVMPDKAIELLIDIATRAQNDSESVIEAEYVNKVVSEKTGIPIGPIGDKERELLLNLEESLHERVVGQRPAIEAIARTMRRARAGIQTPDKPIGSFLFLGPTGVGKTETAKALAHVFFGSEKNLHRLDMSEFSDTNALSRLIGNGIESGILPDMLREHPYSVLLLDEFEKASQSVHDIFLQILDEGIFTDANSNKVNVRNTIIIATSNAGSQLILKTIAQRENLATLNQEIINHIIREGIFRPELLNRFDSKIIFEPLTSEAQGQIAGLMLKGLYERIKEQGYEISLSRDMIDLLVQKGYSPEFGARPMQRVIQDVIEEKIAKKIISGEAEKGSTITLTRADFSDAELAVN